MIYEELEEQITELIDTYNAFIISIDGMVGSKMGELASHLSKKYGAPIIHMSDFKLPTKERKQGWEKEIAGDMDFERFEDDVCTPWIERRPLVFDLWDEKTNEFKERIALPDARMYIVEGTYSSHPQIPDIYDYRIFCKTDLVEQKKRIEKDGIVISNDELQTHNAYILTYMLEALSDAVVDETIQIPVIENEKEN